MRLLFTRIRVLRLLLQQSGVELIVCIGLGLLAPPVAHSRCDDEQQYRDAAGHLDEDGSRAGRARRPGATGAQTLPAAFGTALQDCCHGGQVVRRARVQLVVPHAAVEGTNASGGQGSQARCRGGYGFTRLQQLRACRGAGSVGQCAQARRAQAGEARRRSWTAAAAVMRAPQQGERLGQQVAAEVGRQLRSL